MSGETFSDITDENMFLTFDVDMRFAFVARKKYPSKIVFNKLFFLLELLTLINDLSFRSSVFKKFIDKKLHVQLRIFSNFRNKNPRDL